MEFVFICPLLYTRTTTIQLRGILLLQRIMITGYKPHELGIFNDKHPGIAIIKKHWKPVYAHYLMKDWNGLLSVVSRV